MNYHRFKRKLFVPLLVMPAILTAGPLAAQEAQEAQAAPQGPISTQILDNAGDIATQAVREAGEIQARINQLSDQADELFSQYRDEAKSVDGLVVYNAGMRRTIAEQERTIANYDRSITEAAELQRQIPPLMERMMEALEQFVELDFPFMVDQRQQRLAVIRQAFVDANVSIAEKFRLVLQAYQIENNYGRSLTTYTDTLEIDGVERDVDILQVGRVALVYQTSDQNSSGVYNKETRSWEPLTDDYRRPIARAIGMAKNLSSTDIIELPIIAPESAQ